MYTFSERAAKTAGPIFVFLVVTLTSSVVFIYYYYLLPWNYARWPEYWSVINIIISIWLLINIVFNYFMAVTVKPGYAPSRIENAVAVCKNCIQGKPPRTHHCSVCRKCVLKMDHHCPWLNNCVGHYNHRFFYLFCLYMTLGTCFVALSAFKQFRTYFTWSPSAAIVSFFSSYFNSSTTNSSVESANIGPTLSPDELRTSFWVTYEFVLCLCVTCSLGGLTIWHGYLISKGETSIEKHINLRERKRCRELDVVYKNPYDFSFVENWKVLFGIEGGTGRSWMNVLLPSTHKPTGDGISWRTISNKSN